MHIIFDQVTRLLIFETSWSKTIEENGHIFSSLECSPPKTFEKSLHLIQNAGDERIFLQFSAS